MYKRGESRQPGKVGTTRAERRPEVAARHLLETRTPGDDAMTMTPKWDTARPNWADEIIRPNRPMDPRLDAMLSAGLILILVGVFGKGWSGLPPVAVLLFNLSIVIGVILSIAAVWILIDRKLGRPPSTRR